MKTNATPLTPLDATPMTPPKDELDTALDRLVDKATAGTKEALAQRDELAACLREVVDGFVSGRFTTSLQSPNATYEFALFVQRAQAALLRLDVRERLDDKLQAERKETA